MGETLDNLSMPRSQLVGLFGEQDSANNQVSSSSLSWLASGDRFYLKSQLDLQ